MTTTTDVTAASDVQVPGDWAAGTWVIDPSHTSVGFAVRHLMSRIRGTFDEVSGQIITGTHPCQSTVTATIGMSSVSTGNKMRDDHLRSADFFDAGRYPAMTFSSTAVRPRGDAWVLAGDLTIRDITRPVELQVCFLGTDPAGLKGETRIGFSAHGTISRRLFGITFGLATDGTKVIVGDTVDISLDIEAFACP